MTGKVEVWLAPDGSQIWCASTIYHGPSMPDLRMFPVQIGNASGLASIQKELNWGKAHNFEIIDRR